MFSQTPKKCRKILLINYTKELAVLVLTPIRAVSMTSACTSSKARRATPRIGRNWRAEEMAAADVGPGHRPVSYAAGVGPGRGICVGQARPLVAVGLSTRQGIGVGAKGRLGASSYCVVGLAQAVLTTVVSVAEAEAA